MTDIRAARSAWPTKDGINSTTKFFARNEAELKETGLVTDVRMAYDDSGTTKFTVKIPGDYQPGVLCAYNNMDTFIKFFDSIPKRDWSLDSGAFAAFTRGVPIDLGEYIRFCLHRLKTDPLLVEVFELDVIGNYKASRKNLEIMWREGVPAIPVYHVGEPIQHLKDLVKNFPGKISVGGSVGMHNQRKHAYFSQIFKAIWPARVHGLGISAEDIMMTYPFSSTDTSSWAQFGRWGKWKSMPGVHTHGTHSIVSEVLLFMKLEQKIKGRWAKTLMDIERTCPAWPPKWFNGGAKRGVMASPERNKYYSWLTQPKPLRRIQPHA